MALVEVAKRLFDLRGLYQRRQIRQWFVERSDQRVGGRADSELLLLWIPDLEQGEAEDED